MIEDEQLLEHAQETGFRLCSKEGWVTTDSNHDTWHNVFSATWDPNDSNKLFVCSQNGQLRILDVSSGSSKEYHVLFRRFSPAFEGSAGDLGKPSDNHWDKMILVPNRPGEIIFMLGISKVIMYTAIPGFPHPYPANPMIARTTRGDSSEFIYGTPILELSPHTCRVTALATTSNGHLFASGDEKGNMKISVLVRQGGKCLTSFTSERQSAAKSIAQSRDVHYGEHGDSKVSLKPHGGPSGDSGPIFSIQWLPITIPIVSPTSSSSSTFSEMVPLCYYVATGSSDRAVRVWKVVCCSVKGLTVSPFITLSTTFTNVLSMHSHLVLGGREQIRSDKGREYLYKTLNNMFGSDVIASILNSPTVRNRPVDPFETAPSAPSSSSISSSSRDMMQARAVFREMKDSTYLDLSNASVYLAAGTHTGCAYIWKMSVAEFQSGVPYCTSTYDDGSKLHSLLQSSDHPIVQISLSSAHTHRPGYYPNIEVQYVFSFFFLIFPLLFSIFLRLLLQ
jgi:WD40 repeat protein